jgi:hypothetical protein
MTLYRKQLIGILCNVSNCLFKPVYIFVLSFIGNKLEQFCLGNFRKNGDNTFSADSTIHVGITARTETADVIIIQSMT